MKQDSPFAAAISARFASLHRRAEERVMRADLKQISTLLFPLLLTLASLNSLDVFSTLIGMQARGFQELNPVAAYLFSMQPFGFAVALLVKYLPFIPMGYVALLNADDSRRPMTLRTLKLAVFVALVFSNVFYALVAANNVPQLITLLK